MANKGPTLYSASRSKDRNIKTLRRMVERETKLKNAINNLLEDKENPTLEDTNDHFDYRFSDSRSLYNKKKVNQVPPKKSYTSIDSTVLHQNLKVYGDLEVLGNLTVTGDILVEGALTATTMVDMEIPAYKKKEEPKQKDDILVCRKCKGTKFMPTGKGVVYSIYIENGTPPREEEYKCSECGNTERVRYPAVRYNSNPREIKLPGKD